ncbi:MAG: HDIG domain-containing protein [Clostridia bacterium]|nr:HDIG domain-containing protein [Clostridia bacterium]
MTVKKKSAKKNRLSGLSVLGFLIALIASLIIFVILALAVTPARYDIQVGQPAPNTIKATKDVEDKITTDKLKQDAAAKVKSIFVSDPDVTQEVTSELGKTLKDIGGISVLLISDETKELTQSQLASANEQLDGVNLDMNALKALAAADESTLSSLTADTVSLVESAMDKLLESDVPQAAARIEQGLKDAGYDEALVDIAMTAVNKHIRSNYFYDEQATENQRQAEMDKVDPVTRIKGEVIVSDGEIVTEAQYAMLDALGMVKESTMDVWLYLGIGMLVITLMLAVALYLYMFERAIYQSPKKLLMIALICLIAIVSCVFSREISIYIMPVTLGVIMIALLVNRRVALYINIPLSVIASMLASASGSFINMATYTVVISSLVSGTVALRVLKNRQTRLTVLLAGLVVGISNIVTTFAVGLISSSNLMESLYMALYSGIGGVLSSVLCVALTPAFEVIFNAVTSTRLVELSNPNQPLLRRLLLEAPGTYHHSIIVANLAEAAAGEIGANGLLARVGAYYHDIGKIMRPMYFTENQLGDNPHDRTDPRVSTAIITAHPKDGVQLLKEKRIPEEIRNIVLTHHGNSPVIYFYNKSLTENGEANVDDFRYPGPRPSTREEAIVMLADTVEAAARSIPNADKEKIRELIEKLVSQKIDDGQLDDCDISLRDISRIVSAFVTVLSGAFHDRIEYPKVDIPKKHPEGETP